MISTVKGSAFGNALIKQADANAALNYLGIRESITLTHATNPLLRLNESGVNSSLQMFAGDLYIQTEGVNKNLIFRRNGTTETARINGLNGNFLVGTGGDVSSGKIQLSTHSTAANGFGLGSGLSLYSKDSTTGKLTGFLEADGGYFDTEVRTNLASAFYVGPSATAPYYVVRARRTGWAVATGTKTRTTFATGTVTLAQLAERVAALIDDLHATAGHGLIGT